MQLSHHSSILASSVGFSDISASLATVNIQGTLHLFFSARHSNTLTSVVLGPAPIAATLGDVVYGAQFAPDFAFQTTASYDRFFNFSAPNSSIMTNVVQNSGVISKARFLDTPVGAINDAAAAQVLEFSSGDWLVVARATIGGLNFFQLSEHGVLSGGPTLIDTDKTFLNGISDTATLQRGADQLLLTISALENGISSFLISPSGEVTWIDSYGAQNGMAVNGPSMLQTVQIGGIDFAVVAATNSSSLTVLRVNPVGVFFETDHVIDTGATRFANIASFDGFVQQGRFFIVAGGSDIGLSLFELLPNGALSHLQSFSLEGGAGVTAISGITAEVLGSSVAVFLVDSGSDQVFRYDLDLGNLGGRIDASGGAVMGTAADERIMGSAGADVMNGGGGDDFIHDGAGSDTLTGGAGADVFVFSRDGAVDHITDFQDGIDRIDLSDWGRIYTAQSLVITSTATGAEIVYANERLLITSANGTSLAPSAFTDADFIF